MKLAEEALRVAPAEVEGAVFGECPLPIFDHQQIVL
jgi:hypothetical protein